MATTQKNMSGSSAKYCLHIPVYSTASSNLICYMVQLCIVDGELLSIQEDESQREPLIMCEETESTLCKGMVDVVHWLSFRNVTHATVLRGLCGDSKDDKRVVARALRKVLSWVNDWNDTTPIGDILSNPLSGQVLLDKKFRHCNIRYFMEYSCTHQTIDAHITAPDILLTMIICEWLKVHCDHKAQIQDTLPSIVRYVRNIRAGLLELEGKIIGTESRKHFDAHIARGVDWIDTFDSSTVATESVFKFTQKKGTNQQSAPVNSDVCRTCTNEDVALIESTARALIESAHWILLPSTASSDSTDSSITQLSAEMQGLHLNTQVPFINTLSDKLWETMSLPPGREKRKIQQITSLLEHISALLVPGGVAVEFCSGGGYVGIPLAVLRPDCTVLLTDMNSVSLLYAKKRVKDLGLCNVKLLRCELSHIEEALCSQAPDSVEDDTESAAVDPTNVTAEAQCMLKRFDVGIALHACGSATDAVLRICTAAGASFVVSPCCYGFLQHFTRNTAVVEPADSETAQSCACCAAQDSTSLTTCGGFCSTSTTSAPAETSSGAGSSHKLPQYPQSAAFRAQGWRAGWFAQLCRRADSTFWAHDSRAGADGEGNAAGRLAMRVIDSDRLLCAQENGYRVFGTFMRPLEASVKNHILVGRKIAK